MTFTLAQLNAIEDGIASGTTRVSYDGKSVEYRSFDEMLRIRLIIQTALGLITGKSTTVLAAHNRAYNTGFSSGDTGDDSEISSGP
jgi:hypothetical protein